MKSQCAESCLNNFDQVPDHYGPGDSPTREDVVDALEMLARLLGSPVPLDAEEAECAVDLLAGIPDSEFDGYGDDPMEFRDAWNRQRDLFMGLPDGLPLEESYYKEWTSDDSHPLAGQTGLSCGDPAAHMAAVLGIFGIELSPEDPKSPDNLAVLLEFLALLVENRTHEEVVAFCTDHLDWLPELRREAHTRGIEGAFHQLIGTVESLVRQIISM